MHKYERVLEVLSETVRTSPPVTRIPTEKELAAEFDVSTMTVRRALQILVESGRLHGVPGRGTFVAVPKVTKLVSASNSFTDAMRASGRTPGSRLIEASIRPCSAEEAREFEVETGDLIAVVRRVRLGDGAPLGLERATLNAALLPGLLGHDLNGSIYEVIASKYGLEIERTGLVVSARHATPEEAGLLEVPTDLPCLQTDVTSRAGGAVLERTVSLYRGDMYEVAV